MTSFYLMVYADGRLHGGTFDRDNAVGFAMLSGGVAVELPVISDRRGMPVELPPSDTDRKDAPA